MERGQDTPVQSSIFGMQSKAEQGNNADRVGANCFRINPVRKGEHLDGCQIFLFFFLPVFCFGGVATLFLVSLFLAPREDLIFQCGEKETQINGESKLPF